MQVSKHPDVEVVRSYEAAVARLEERREELHTCWVIGGSSVYREALERPDTDRLFLTEIKGEFGCDTFFPPLGAAWGEEGAGGLVPEGVQVRRALSSNALHRSAGGGGGSVRVQSLQETGAEVDAELTRQL
jgi:dihydrofolate reductase